MLNEDGFDRFRVQRVLDSAGVSRATLYRHFPDVDGLIEAALVEAFRQEVDLYSGKVAALVESATNVTTFRLALRDLLNTFSTGSPLIRLRRTHTIALASTRPGLAASIAMVQEVLTDGWDATIQECQKRGFVRKGIDSRAAAVIIQSIALGRVVDDAALSHVSNQLWAKMFFEFVDRTLLVSEN